MPIDVLLGLQWGDEGKGKVVDFIAPRYQVVARFQGGPNAGHTLVVNGEKHVSALRVTAPSVSLPRQQESAPGENADGQTGYARQQQIEFTALVRSNFVCRQKRLFCRAGYHEKNMAVKFNDI